MLISTAKNSIIIGSRCPFCLSDKNNKVFLNGLQCFHPAHQGKTFCFYWNPSDKKIHTVQVIEGSTSILFNFRINSLILELPLEEDIELPLFDFDDKTVSVKAVKDLTVFT